MIRLITILFLVSLVGCTPPTDVDAERKQSNFKNPDPNALLLVSDVVNINFGDVYYAETNSRKIRLTNISGENYTIDGVEFERQPTVFFIDETNFPITLEPDQTLDLTVSVRQTNYGVFEDMLIIDGERAPQVELRSKLPAFQLDYDEEWLFEKDDIGVRLVTVINNSLLPISITRIYFSGNNSQRFQLDFDPRDYAEIRPGEIFKLPIKFDAKSEGTQKVMVSFEIMSSDGIEIVTANLVAKVNP